MAGGDISITGQGTTTSSFQGLILAEGSFKAKDTTLIGSALTLDRNGSVQLERVRTVAARDLTKIDLSYAAVLKELTESYTSGAGGGRSTQEIGVMYRNNFTHFKPSNYHALESLAETIVSGNDPWKIVVREKLPDGTYKYSDTPSTLAHDDFYTGLDLWSKYEEQVRKNEVVYVNTFQLDFNKFLKTKGGFRPLLQRVSSL